MRQSRPSKTAESRAWATDMTDLHHSQTQARDEDGNFFHKMEAPCKCGHSLGKHDAHRTKRDGKTVQACQGEDLMGGCDCDCFSKKRAPRRKKEKRE